MNSLVKLVDWIGNSTSSRFSFDWEDAQSVVRAIILAGATAGLAELANVVGGSIADDSPTRIITYVVIALVLNAIRKWAANGK
jgi:hypothetical protein